jgi:hypothetical protein
VPFLLLEKGCAKLRGGNPFSLGEKVAGEAGRMRAAPPMDDR